MTGDGYLLWVMDEGTVTPGIVPLVRGTGTVVAEEPTFMKSITRGPLVDPPSADHGAGVLQTRFRFICTATLAMSPVLPMKGPRLRERR